MVRDGWGDELRNGVVLFIMGFDCTLYFIVLNIIKY